MTDFGKEPEKCSWLPEIFVLFPNKWSRSSALDSFKGASFYLEIVERE